MVAAVSNSTTTTQTTSAKDTASLTSNYTTFLNLLTAQIKNQDPLSPMDTTQWTNQLVQYSGVEQQLKTNGYLEELVGAGNGNSMNAAVSYIGKTVSADQSTSALSGGKAAWTYTLGASAATTTLTISDSNGKVVWSDAAPDSTKGTHDFTWDGKSSSGQQLADGNYTLRVTAANGDTTVASSVGITGTVTSAHNTGTDVVLNIGNTEVPISSVKTVS